MASTPRVTIAILAGGLGTRLGDEVSVVPKPMIEVGGKPFLERVIRSFSEQGFTDFALLTGYRSGVIESYFGDGSRMGIRIRYSCEEEPAGTGGAIRLARKILGIRFLLTYGDVYRRFDYARFVTAHRSPCIAAYPSPNGNTAVENGKVTRFDKSATLPYMEAGFCVMTADVIDYLGDTGSFEETVFPKLAAERYLDCEIIDQNFVEIGTPEALANARRVLA
jgi:NDP-sugar pyrophosphorylase family protein